MEIGEPRRTYTIEPLEEPVPPEPPAEEPVEEPESVPVEPSRVAVRQRALSAAD